MFVGALSRVGGGSRRDALWLVVVVVLVASLGVEPSRARACSTCTVGDPTLTVMGAELPSAGRLRLSTALRWRTEREREGPRVVERRLELGVAWSPTSRLTLAFGAPLVSRRARYANLAEERSIGLGDLDLRARVVLFRDRPFAPRHLFAGVVGLELPTAWRSVGPHDDDPEQQPGSRTWDPLAGLTYGFFREPFSLAALAVLVAPVDEGIGGVRPGLALRGTLRAQWQPHAVFGVALGADLRVDGREHLEGQRVSESGGAILYGTAGVVIAPLDDVVIDLRLSLPVWQGLRGGHDEGVVAFAGVTIDA